MRMLLVGAGNVGFRFQALFWPQKRKGRRVPRTRQTLALHCCCWFLEVGPVGPKQLQLLDMDIGKLHIELCIKTDALPVEFDLAIGETAHTTDCE